MFGYVTQLRSLSSGRASSTMEFSPAIYAVQGVDTVASTFTDSDGGYLLRGLAAGTYGVFYKPSDITYKDSLRTNISVSTNAITKIDTTFLHQ
jgi:hypothetical protein